MVVSESFHVLPSNTPSAVNVSRVARSTREVAALLYSSSSSSRPPPQLLWQVLIVLSTAVSRCLNWRSPLCHLRPTFTCEISSRRPKLVSGHQCSSAPGASSPRVHAIGSKTAPSSRFVRLSVGLVIGCPIISKIDDRHGPNICHVALPAVNSCTTPQDVRLSLRSPSQGSFRQPTLAAVVHLIHAPNLRFYCCLLNSLLFLNVGPLFVCCNITLFSVGSIPSDGIHNHLQRHPLRINCLCTWSYISIFA